MENHIIRCKFDILIIAQRDDAKVYCYDPNDYELNDLPTDETVSIILYEKDNEGDTERVS